MQIRIAKFRDKLTLLQPAVPRKPTMKILSNVLIKDGTITATDLESRISVGLEEAEGSCWLLPYKSVMSFLKYVPGDEILTVDPNHDKKLLLSWDDGSASFDAEDAKDYPSLDLKDSVSSGSLDGDSFTGALMAAVKYCSTGTEKPIITGVTVYLGNVIQVAAADGFRLTFQSLNLKYPDPVNKQIVIPAATVAILGSLWKQEPAQVGLAADLISQITARRQLEVSIYGKDSDQTIEFKFGKVTLVSRLLAGTPPDHLALLNEFKEPIKSVFMGSDLFNAIRRVRSVANGGSGTVRLQWDEAKMTVSAANNDGAEVSAKISLLDHGNSGRIAIEVGYLLDYLADKSGVIVMGKSDNPEAPALFHYGNRPIVALMPMKVKWGDEPPDAEEENASESEDETKDENLETTEGSEEPETVGAGVGGPAENKKHDKGTKPKQRGRKKNST